MADEPLKSETRPASSEVETATVKAAKARLGDSIAVYRRASQEDVVDALNAFYVARDAYAAAVRSEGAQWFHRLDAKGRCLNSKCYQCERTGLQQRIEFTKDYETIRGQLEAADSRLRELMALINEDGSLQTDEEHLDTLKEAMHAHTLLPQLEAMESRLREQDAEIANAEQRGFIAGFNDPCGGNAVEAYQAWKKESQ